MLRLRLVFLFSRKTQFGLDGMSGCALGDGLARGYKSAQVYGAHGLRSIGLTEDRNSHTQIRSHFYQLTSARLPRAMHGSKARSVAIVNAIRTYLEESTSNSRNCGLPWNTAGSNPN